MCSGAGRNREWFAATGPGTARRDWGSPPDDRLGYGRIGDERWGYVAGPREGSSASGHHRPTNELPRHRPGLFVGPAVVLAFIMAASIAPSSPQEMSLVPLLIFPMIAALMMSRHRRPRHQGQQRPGHQGLRGTRGYRETVPAPWNRPDEYSDEGGSQRVAKVATPRPAPKAWPVPAKDVRSPFDRPAFWDQEPSAVLAVPASRAAVSEPAPPAWDPLGVAPFAWDLPDPPSPPRPRRRFGQATVARLAAGTALLVLASTVVGDVAGWWPISTVVAASWAVVALMVGLVIGAHRSRAAADR